MTAGQHETNRDCKVMQDGSGAKGDTKISILIVAFNSAALIADCINSIRGAYSKSDYEVLLIDNGDGQTEALVAAQYPTVRLVPSRGNIGFAAANNALATYAKGEYLLLLNPDVELCPGALDALMEGVARYPSAAAWGGVTLNEEGEPDLGNSVHLPSLSEMASRTVGRSIAAKAGQARTDKDRVREALSGAFVLIDHNAWLEVGGMDGRYFLYCEEVDLFYRLGREGHKIWQIADARAHHYLGHGEAYSSNRMLFRAAGTMQFARLHWSKLKKAIAFVLLWVGAWQRWIAGILLGRWVHHLRVVGQSHRQLALRPGLWRNGYDPHCGLLTRMSV